MKEGAWACDHDVDYKCVPPFLSNHPSSPTTIPMEMPTIAPGAFLYRIRIDGESYDFVHQISELDTKFKTNLAGGVVCMKIS